MILNKLLNGLDYKTNIDDLDKIYIKNITTDSRNLKPGDVFICITGSRFDGHKFAKNSLLLQSSKDIIVITQKNLELKNQIVVKDTRKAYAKLAANYFGNPADKLKLIGVTGTNGKTSTTYIIKHILESFGKKVGLIGTIQNQIEDMIFPAKYTTPDPWELNALLKKMVDYGCEYVIMEISSHALDQQRVFGLNFKVAVFTNLTQDHLDYHITMKNYFQAKKKLFDMCENAVINIDDDYGRTLFENIKCSKISYSVNNKADIYCENISVSKNGTDFKLILKSKIYNLNINMLGKFFAANSVAAVAVAMILGFDINQILESLKICSGVKGRAEILPVEADFTVIRDYAHGPDGIEKILDAVNQFAPSRVVILFGCAGRRDRTKRKLMTDIAAKKSDYVILTSDNPRDEDPNIIINDALEGLEKNNTPYKIIIDRYQAIKWAIENSQKDDILILAGKGHEDYQVLDFGTVYFDEYEIVSEILDNKLTKRKEKNL